MRRVLFILTFLASGLANGESIPMVKEHGTFVVPVVLNNSIRLKFTVDSGAADVSVPADVFSTLVRSGTVTDDDLLGTQQYRLADGSEQRSQRFRIKSLKVGTVELHDVIASVMPAAGDPLLGQSFLSRLRSWSVDNDRHLLLLNESSNSEGDTARRAGAPEFRPPKPAAASGQSDELVFLKALAFLLTGDDLVVPPAEVRDRDDLPPGRNLIAVMDRSKCIVKFQYRENFFERPLVAFLRLNNVDLNRSGIRSAGNDVKITFRGEHVVDFPARPAFKDAYMKEADPARPASSSSTFTLAVETDEVARVRRAWNYVYSHGCKGTKSPF